MMRPLLSLDDPVALQASVVGVKAARLARARLLELPVLPGMVVPVAAGRDAIDRGARALAAGRSAHARAEVFGTASTDALTEALGAMALPDERFVARSSTSVDDDGSLAGAFASFGDLRAADLVSATRGCWASLFAPESLTRLGRIGRSPSDVGLAVLIQGQLRPTAGGWARMHDGDVEVAAVAGHPGPLLSGAVPGTRIRVPADQRTRVDVGADSPVAGDQVERLVEMARRAARLMDVNRIEWAFDGEDLFLLQASRIRSDAAPTPRVRPTADASEAYIRLAGILLDRRGPLADLLLLPWAGASWSQHVATIAGSPDGLYRQLIHIAARLRAEVADALGWDPLDALPGSGVEDAGHRANLLASVTIDQEAAAALLGAGQALGDALVAQGLLLSSRALWRQSSEWLEAAVISGDPPSPSSWRLPTRADEILLGVCTALGVERQGVAASDGQGVGRVIRVDGRETTVVDDGDVVVADAPLTSLAPLLWRASALVTVAGSPGAHLCEVARSLRVPTVVGLGRVPALDRSVMAVDGTRGQVHVWNGTG